MIPRIPFGSTGHESTRIIFGAAALWRSDEAAADHTLELLFAHGINHIDAAASYGDAEILVGRWMPGHRDAFFLATKTGDRDYAGARDSIRRSLERMKTDRVDLIQLHGLVKPDEWEQALGDDGALRACVEARDEGLVRFIGVTGHGTRVAQMHAKSLERFPFDSVLLPYNFSMMQQAEYAADFEGLASTCEERGAAVQTIKAVARRRWPEGVEPNRDCWYEPYEAQADVDLAVHYVLARPNVFLNTVGDLTVLPRVLDAAERFAGAPSDDAMRGVGAEPLFVRGYAAGAPAQ